MKKRHARVIQEIQDRIPKDLLQRLMKKELANPAAKRVVEEALKKPDSEVPAKKKRRLQALLDSGYLDQMVEVIDPEIEKQIDDFITKEIAIAVQLGRLPKEAPKMESLTNKGHQYARRQHNRLKALFTGTDSDVDSDPQGGPKDQGQHPTRPNDGGVLLSPGIDAGR